MNPGTLPKSIEWVGELDGHVRLIDQTRLPGELTFLECRNVATMREAILTLRVRGAPVIGIAGAFGAVLGVRDYKGSDRSVFMHILEEVCSDLRTVRPTAVNLARALDRLLSLARALPDVGVKSLKLALLEEAGRIRDEDAAICRRIGRHGEFLIPDGAGVLTHCNAGALATAEYGTALAPMYAAQEKGRTFRAFATETRPLLQGSRLTAWELGEAGIDVTLVCDNMVGAIMRQGLVDLVITGADRIAANGDVANKVGTYGVAVLAYYHGIPFYVAAPSTTFDPGTPDGSTIPIEQRDPDEVRCGFGVLTAPADVSCHCAAFDVTPAGLIRGIITENGLIQPVSRQGILEVLSGETTR